MKIKEIHKLESELILLIAKMSKYKFWTKEYKKFILAYNKLATEIRQKKSMLTNAQLEKYLNT